MIVVMQPYASESQVQHVIDRLIELGFDVHRSTGEETTVIGALGVKKEFDTGQIEGLDGVQKMSKSLGNYVGINEPPTEMFGKLMSISDNLMWRYYLLLTDLPPSKVDALKAAVAKGNQHPLDVKKALARRIVIDFHGESAAAEAQSSFEKQFQQDRLPVDIPYHHWRLHQPVKLFRLLVELRLFPSNAEAQRKIKEGAVSIADFTPGAPHWRRMDDPAMEIRPAQFIGDYVVRAGRRMVRVSFTS